MGNFLHQEAIALTSIRYVNIITNFQVKGAQTNISEARRLKNIAWRAKSMSPCRGNTSPFSFLIATPSSSDPEGLLLAVTVPFQSPRLASCVASETTENEGHHQIWHSSKRKGPDQPSRSTITQTLIVRLFKFHALVFVVSKIEGPEPTPWPSSLPPYPPFKI